MKLPRIPVRLRRDHGLVPDFSGLVPGPRDRAPAANRRSSSKDARARREPTSAVELVPGFNGLVPERLGERDALA